MHQISLQDQVAYVTGASGGIGRAVAELLAAHGAHVVLAGRHREALEDQVAALNASMPGTASLSLADVSDSAQVRAAFTDVFRVHKRLDILVNNAGVLLDARLGMISDDAIDTTLAVNTRGSIVNLQLGARLMQRRKYGSIINITSIIGVQGNAGQTVYAASKAAVIGLTKAAAKELAPHQIRVNAIAPGFINTRMIAHLDASVHQQRLKSIKMGRIGDPRDIAHAVLFLASDLSSYVTGQILGVDGGMEVG